MKSRLLFLSLLCYAATYGAESKPVPRALFSPPGSDNVVVRVPARKKSGPKFLRRGAKVVLLRNFEDVSQENDQTLLAAPMEYLRQEIAEEKFPPQAPATPRGKSKTGLKRQIKVQTGGVTFTVPRKKEFFNGLLALLKPLAQDLPKGARVIGYKFDERVSQEGSLVFETTVRTEDGERASGGRIALKMVAENVEEDAE